MLFRSPPIGECLGAIRPGLATQWHPTKNGNLLVSDVFPNASLKVWWQCENGHEWQSTINSRKNEICPFCAGKRACPDNNLLARNPSLAAQWHPTKNGELTPLDVLPKSNKKVWWVCGNGHEWQATITSRTSGSGCPYCGGKKTNGANCLETINPSLAKEWHPIMSPPIIN